MLNSRLLKTSASISFGRRVFVGDAAIEGAIFCGLLTTIALAAVPIGAVEARSDAIFEGVILMLGVCWITTMILSKRWPVQAVIAPLAGLILLACLQTLPFWRVSVDPSETRRFIIKSLTVGLTLGMLLDCTSSRKRLLALEHLVVFVGAASAGLALLLWLAPATEVATRWYYNLQGESFGQFVNRNHFALLMEMSLGPTLALAVCASGRVMFCLYAAIALLLSLALVLANSRGGIIGMLGQFAFFSWIWFGSFQRSSFKWSPYGHHRLWRISEALARRTILTVFFLGVAFATVLWLGGEPVRNRLESVPSEFMRRSSPTSVPRRLEIWASTWKLIADHPVSGSGLGAYKTAISNYFPASYYWLPQQAHNDYLELLAGGGIIGTALGVWFVFIVVRETRKRLNEPEVSRRSVCLGGLVGLVGVAIHCLVDFGLHVMVNALICCSLIAIATAIVPLTSGSPRRRWIRTDSAVKADLKL